MSKLPSYLKDRSLENNVCASVDSWDNEYKIGRGSCSGCCFRNWRKMCDQMPCFDAVHGVNVSWYTLHMPENDAVILLNHFKDLDGNTKELAEKKRAELFEFLESGNGIDEWKIKKYDEAWRRMGRG